MTPRILLLGGTREALTIARELDAQHIYSLAGLGKVPDDLTCAVRVGGFGGAAGMAKFITEQHIDLLLDATHPYAAQISANAAAAAVATAIPYWALRRPGWEPQADDDWREVGDWQELVRALADFQRPFFTLGREPLRHLDEIPASQFWTIRCLDAEPGNSRSHIIGARGPFQLDAERALFAENNFDVLISKNSGSIATEPKLQIARERQVPVLILKRPPLPVATREFDSVAAANVALREIGATGRRVSNIRYFAGIGCRRGCSEISLRTLLEESLQQHGLQIHQLRGLASIDRKIDEAGLIALAKTLQLPLQFFSADQLLLFSDRVTPSATVEREVGIANIAEACALAAAETYGNQSAELIIHKCKNADATFALARVLISDDNP